MTHLLRHLHSHFAPADRKKYLLHMQKVKKEKQNPNERWDHEYVYDHMRHTLCGKNFININFHTV